jgi:hypothetical protein
MHKELLDLKNFSPVLVLSHGIFKLFHLVYLLLKHMPGDSTKVPEFQTPCGTDFLQTHSDNIFKGDHNV